jgi:hypothetical protein
VPPFATDAAGRPTQFFVSTTSLADPQRPMTDPLLYLDARTIPHFVLPRGEAGPFTTRYEMRLGDLALLVLDGRGTFAVFGDAGPAGKLGEASPAVITRLRGQPDLLDRLPRAVEGGVTTLLLPGSRSHLQQMPPRSAGAIAEAGAAALAAVGGLAAFAACPGLAGPIAIAPD